jgi:hypothetical protein
LRVGVGGWSLAFAVISPIYNFKLCLVPTPTPNSNSEVNLFDCEKLATWQEAKMWGMNCMNWQVLYHKNTSFLWGTATLCGMGRHQ